MEASGGPLVSETSNEVPKGKNKLQRALSHFEFDNPELERLYKKYVYKLQQATIGYMLAVFILLTSCLAVLNFFYLFHPTVRGIYLCVQCLFFIAVFVFINTRYMEETYFMPLCYLLLFFLTVFAAMSFPIPFGDLPPINTRATDMDPEMTDSHVPYATPDTLNKNIAPYSESLFSSSSSFSISDLNPGPDGVTALPYTDGETTGVEGLKDTRLIIGNGYYPDTKYLSLPVQGVWEVAFVIFMVYTLMPLQRLISVLLGILLPTGHLITAALLSSGTTGSDSIQLSLWRQVIHTFPFYFRNLTPNPKF